MERIREIYQAHKRTGDGSITYAQLVVLLQTLDPGLSENHIQIAVAAIGADKLTFDDFLNWVYGRPGPPDTTKVEEASHSEARMRSTLDMRWDSEGFEEWCRHAQIMWVPVGYFRKIHREGHVIPHRQRLPPEAQRVGIPPKDVQLYLSSHCWLSRDHADPDGFHLARLVAVLDQDGAFDGDLVFMDWTGIPQRIGDFDRELQHRGSYIDGIVPAKCQPWVISYSWSAHLHPFPGGGKIAELASALLQYGAQPSDVVFIDYLSLPQGEAKVPAVYRAFNPQGGAHPASCCCDSSCGESGEVVILPGRTEEQERQFRYALFETTRLYAFRGGTLPNGEEVLGCIVLVLPRMEEPASFPDHGHICLAMNTFCNPPRQELLTSWGFCKSVPYEQGGWTCAEYAVARKCGTIANMDSPMVGGVSGVEQARSWATTAQQYAEMMDEYSAKPVAFTKKGDRDAVRFNFYKYTHHFNDQMSVDTSP